MQPLKGITVVSLEHAIAGPFATRQLADLGARVIKVERPGSGDFARGYDKRTRGMASHFVWTNRSKESLSIDVKHPDMANALFRLVAQADVLVQNLAPGAADRLGLGYETLAAINPGIIVCDISGYGSDGPDRDRKAYDLLIQSESGFLSVTGTPDEMVKAGPSIADISAGMYAYSNILAALLERQKTGKGRHIDISMLESLSEWMSYPLYYAIDGQEPPPRAGAAHATIFPYGPFESADGSRVMFGLQNSREWGGFCRIVLQRDDLADNPDYADNSGRQAARPLLEPLIRDLLRQLSPEEMRRRLDAAQIANARVNSLHELWSHPQLKARNRWRTVDSPVGPLPTLLPPGSWDEEPRLDAVPALGQHTDAILESLGISAGEREVLRSVGAIQ
jgi:itaconate CoA-transferase